VYECGGYLEKRPFRTHVGDDQPGSQAWLRIYFARMKIEELTVTEKLARFDQAHEQAASLHGENGQPFMLTFTIGLLVGEELRDLLYGEQSLQMSKSMKQNVSRRAFAQEGQKVETLFWLFVLLKQKWTLSHEQKTAVLDAALTTFEVWFINVRTFV